MNFIQEVFADELRAAKEAAIAKAIADAKAKAIDEAINEVIQAALKATEEAVEEETDRLRKEFAETNADISKAISGIPKNSKRGIVLPSFIEEVFGDKIKAVKEVATKVFEEKTDKEIKARKEALDRVGKELIEA
ncbi:MAG: hypothetical protein LBT59_21500 [Clostridiales bacterium]|nr:hypothetical protein [Clostridiales bacterium]